MQGKIKNIIVVISFVAILSIGLLANIIAKDNEISTSERRKLAQFPKITVKKLLDGDVSEDLEKYAVDQFVGRDFFRGIKSYVSKYAFGQLDNNGLFIKDGAIYKIEYPLNKEYLEKVADKINDVYKKYLENMNVYYAIIPDKNYYLEDAHLKIDYKEVQNIIQNRIENIKYIDLLPELTIEDYYKTDTHWKQPNIRKVVSKIEKGMDLKDTSKVEYQEKELGDFYGVYYSQIGMKVKPDTLKYLTNDTIENCITYNYETKETGKVYDLNKYNTSTDKYDIFLSGATPIISIENPKANNNKELLLFRDSFGSSIAPLLIENYEKITLIDIRYISSDLLENYIEFNNQDVLFLYSGLVLNHNIFK